MRRMDRYKDETPDRPNRYEKNQELYQDIASNTKYTNITDVTNSNAFEINGFKNKKEKYRENLTNDISTIKEQNKELITKNEELAKNNQELTNLIKSLQDQLWVKK